MKATYEKVFAEHVAAAIAKAKDIGASASWSTEKHLDAVADVLKRHGDSPEAVRDILGECYNVSGYGQMLAKRFEKTGHFQRSGRKAPAEQLDDIYADLVKQG